MDVLAAVKKAVEQGEVTRREMAREFGVHEVTVSRWLSGGTDVRHSRVMQMWRFVQDVRREREAATRAAMGDVA